MAAVLIADDNAQIINVLRKYLMSDGYEVIAAYDGEAALEAFRRNKVDVVLLDVMMPRVDGFEVCRQIRKTSDVPILIITARSEDFERIMGLDIGADDYIVKPFSPGEVLARIRAVLRRLQPRTGDAAYLNRLSYDNLVVDLNHYRVTVGGSHVPLSKRAVEILYALLLHPERIYTREMLIDSLWGKEFFGDIRTVDSQIKRMRCMLAEFPHPGWEIKTIWGLGYKFEKHESK